MKKVISVDGMKCVHCQAKVEKVLSELAGVKSCKVDLDKKTATVSLATEVEDTVLTKAVTDAGFTPVKVETKKGLFS